MSNLRFFFKKMSTTVHICKDGIHVTVKLIMDYTYHFFIIYYLLKNVTRYGSPVLLNIK